MLIISAFDTVYNTITTTGDWKSQRVSQLTAVTRRDGSGLSDTIKNDTQNNQRCARYFLKVS